MSESQQGPEISDVISAKFYIAIFGLPYSKELLKRVLQNQKRVARIIFDAERTTHTLTMFNKLNWIPFFIEGFVN